MSAYYPFGKPLELTPEQYQQQLKRFELYDYYGIPYGIFDDTPESSLYSMQKEIDRNEASMLIMQNKELPEDLKQKLLKYKQEDEAQQQRQKQIV